jgi:PqqD family protein of HPr-rel-A system
MTILRPRDQLTRSHDSRQLNFLITSDADLRTWRLRAGQRLRILNDADESVVYNDYSGETHLLSAIAVSLLQKLQQDGPANRREISARLASEWEFESNDEAQQVTHNLLDELDVLGLIELFTS